jgi:hypothetical protein
MLLRDMASRHRTLLKAVLLLAAISFLPSACSKTVQWEEEVPLNTGETIWVKRSVKYKIQGGAGNPFDLALRPVRDETIEFVWKGKAYRYTGDAGISLLAISQQQTPVLVANASDNSWDAMHHYQCTAPYYVQLIPDESGRAWNWLPKIEEWLFNLPTNLLLARHPPERMKQRYTAVEVQRENRPGSTRFPQYQKIDPTHTSDLCRRK